MSKRKPPTVDWHAYAVRDAYTLFELACLLNRADPRSVIEEAEQGIEPDIRRELARRGAMAAALFDLPEMYLGEPVGATLARLKVATGHGMPAPLPRSQALKVAQALGYKFPPELTGPALGPETAPAAASSGPTPAGKRWTPELIEEARAMVERFKGDGQGAWMQRAAAHYRVSASRLSAVLREAAPSNPPAATWPAARPAKRRRA
jgi:hypothetical protein